MIKSNSHGLDALPGSSFPLEIDGNDFASFDPGALAANLEAVIL